MESWPCSTLIKQRVEFLQWGKILQNMEQNNQVLSEKLDFKKNKKKTALVPGAANVHLDLKKEAE